MAGNQNLAAAEAIIQGNNQPPAGAPPVPVPVVPTFQVAPEHQPHKVVDYVPGQFSSYPIQMPGPPNKVWPRPCDQNNPYEKGLQVRHWGQRAAFRESNKGDFRSPHMPILIEPEPYDRELVKKETAQFAKQIGPFPGVGHDIVRYIERCDKYQIDNNLPSLEMALVVSSNLTSDARIWYDTITRTTPGVANPDAYPNIKYYGPQAAKEKVMGNAYCPAGWGQHKVTNVTRRDSVNSDPGSKHYNEGEFMANGQIAPEGGVEARAAQPGVHGWSTPQEFQPTVWDAYPDSRGSRGEPEVLNTACLRAYLIKKFYRRPTEDKISKLEKAFKYQRKGMYCSTYVNMCREYYFEYFRAAHDPATQRLLGGTDGEHFKQARLRYTRNGLNVELKKYLEQCEHFSAQNADANPNGVPDEEPPPLITTLEQLERFCSRWEQMTEQGKAWARSCSPFQAHKPAEVLAFQHESLASERIPIELMVDLENPLTGPVSLEDYSPAPVPPDTPQATGNATAAAATTDGKAAAASKQARGKQPPKSSLVDQKAKDGFDQWWVVSGPGGTRVLKLVGNQPCCNFCGIKSHNRDSCAYLKKFRASNPPNMAQFHPNRGNIVSLNAQKPPEERAAMKAKSKANKAKKAAKAAAAKAEGTAAAATGTSTTPGGSAPQTSTSSAAKKDKFAGMPSQFASDPFAKSAWLTAAGDLELFRAILRAKQDSVTKFVNQTPGGAPPKTHDAASLTAVPMNQRSGAAPPLRSSSSAGQTSRLPQQHAPNGFICADCDFSHPDYRVYNTHIIKFHAAFHPDLCQIYMLEKDRLQNGETVNSETFIW